MDSYWTRFTEGRSSRRRLLQGAAGLGIGAGALALVGCGGGSDSGGSTGGGVPGDTSGLLSRKVDHSKDAVAGNTWASYRAEDVISLNPLVNTQGAAQTEMLWGYSTLVKHSFAAGERVGPEGIVGDAMESWEISPDAMKVVMKLRPNLKLDPRPPTSGRNVTVEDIKYSWNTAEKSSPFRASLFNSASPGGPIKSMETPDANTIVINLAFPYGPVLEILGHHQHPLVVPVEAEGKFNASAEMRGSGPFILANYQQSSRFEYERNPGYYVKGRPLFDRVVKPIITDYAAGLAQFEAGAIWDFEVKPEDILRVKREHPEMVMYSALRPSGYIAIKSYHFSKQPGVAVSDVRVRRAFSMTIDRDLYIDAMENVSQFEREGLPVETAWNGPLAAYFPSWLDPRDESQIGEGAKYYKYDVPEAKKMLQAAGYNGRVKFPWGYYNDRGTEHAKANEIVVQMGIDSGLFDIPLEPLSYASTYRPTCQSNGMGYQGACYNTIDGFNEDAALVNVYTPEGKFATAPAPIPGITDVVLASRSEVDPKRRSELLKQVQRKAAVDIHYLPVPGLSLGFTLRWPWLENHGNFERGGATAREFTEAWYEAKKRPA